MLAENLAVVERLRTPGPDVRATLEDVAYRLIKACCADRSRSLRWLTYAQVAQFPDLIDIVVSRTSDQLAEALADRLARLALSSHLRAGDPATAAEQFLVLITGPMEGRSRLGTRKVPTAEMRTVATAAVDTFLRAYGVPEN
ncbi:TetR/AcrR family transcriptional regulator C-terminal domain-containing protein [Nocardia crassostreae]|uniref:TetR/AcrR family transcriptional regulator C-terminal domain-containing protein n=1 Tax=Nocardia crassostreae TaxID=53428 RepID=UPI000A8EF3B6|nr:TetR/AcrR family transcriptional regulator C-terminal domain-containing protein [Nocardia crassostreae]